MQHPDYLAGLVFLVQAVFLVTLAGLDGVVGQDRKVLQETRGILGNPEQAVILVIVVLD
jgi:hypothetical protein